MGVVPVTFWIMVLIVLRSCEYLTFLSGREYSSKNDFRPTIKEAIPYLGIKSWVWCVNINVSSLGLVTEFRGISKVRPTGQPTVRSFRGYSFGTFIYLFIISFIVFVLIYWGVVGMEEFTFMTK